MSNCPSFLGNPLPPTYRIPKTQPKEDPAQEEPSTSGDNKLKNSSGADKQLKKCNGADILPSSTLSPRVCTKQEDLHPKRPSGKQRYNPYNNGGQSGHRKRAKSTAAMSIDQKQENGSLDISLPMDVDMTTIKSVRTQNESSLDCAPSSSTAQLSTAPSSKLTMNRDVDNETIYFVLDTNVFIHNMDFAVQLISEHQTGKYWREVARGTNFMHGKTVRGRINWEL